MLKFSMAPNRILIPLMIVLLVIGRGQVVAQTALESGQNPHVTAKQPADVVLSVRFKEGVYPRLRIGEGGRTQVCIPAVDSLNRLFGCQAVKPRFPNSQYAGYAAGSREYFIFLGTDSSFTAARSAYLGIGCFEFILDESRMWVGDGWGGRIKANDLNQSGPAQALPVINARVLYVKFKANSPISVRKAQDGVAEVGLAAVDAISRQYGCTAIGKRFKGKTPRYDYDADLSFAFQFSRDIDVHQAKKDYWETGAFVYIEVASPIKVTGGSTGFIPNDARYPDQWGLNNDSITIKTAFPNASVRLGADINMEAAWDCEQGDTSVIAAILDTGCKTDHPDLTSRLWTNYADIPNDNLDNDGNGFVDDSQGWDFKNGDKTVNDIDPGGHGTGISALVGAEGDNGIGISGVDLKCKLMIVKFVDTLQSNIDPTRLDSAIRYAVDNGASVINFSYNFNSPNAIIRDAILYARDHEVQFVSITGNGGMNGNNLYPAAYPDSLGILIVGATDPDDRRSSLLITGGGSNWTDFIDVCAPGNYIRIPDNVTDTEYYWVGGSSAAAAYVTGLYTLLKSQNPGLGADSISAIIKRTADDQVGDPTEDTPGFDRYHGMGRINAERALCSANAISPGNPSTLEVAIFPNPSSGTVFVTTLAEGVRKVSVSIFDAQGRKVSSQEFRGNAQIEVQLPRENGLYVVSVVANGNRRAVTKVLKVD